MQQPAYHQPPVYQGSVPTAPLLQGQCPTQPGVVIVGASYGRDQTTMQCPHCKQQIRTSTKSKIGVMGKFLSFIKFSKYMEVFFYGFLI